jgi:hypothetical protein
MAQAVVEGDGELLLLLVGLGDLQAKRPRLDGELLPAIGALRDRMTSSHRKEGQEKKGEPWADDFSRKLGPLPAAGADGADRAGAGIIRDDRSDAEKKDESAPCSLLRIAILLQHGART